MKCLYVELWKILTTEKNKKITPYTGKGMVTFHLPLLSILELLIVYMN